MRVQRDAQAMRPASECENGREPAFPSGAVNRKQGSTQGRPSRGERSEHAARRGRPGRGNRGRDGRAERGRAWRQISGSGTGRGRTQAMIARDGSRREGRMRVSATPRRCGRERMREWPRARLPVRRGEPEARIDARTAEPGRAKRARGPARPSRPKEPRPRWSRGARPSLAADLGERNWSRSNAGDDRPGRAATRKGSAGSSAQAAGGRLAAGRSIGGTERPVGRGGHGANLATGMPRRRALSTRFSVMPDAPAKTRRPFGRRSSMASFRRNGAARP